MKYATNHPWKFEQWFNAYMVGLTQLVVVVGISFVNLIIRLSDETLIQVAMNFVDLILISEFGEMYYTMISGDRLTKLIGGSLTLDQGAPITLAALLEIETTTSLHARGVNDKNKLKKSPFSQHQIIMQAGENQEQVDGDEIVEINNQEDDN